MLRRTRFLSFDLATNQGAHGVSVFLEHLVARPQWSYQRLYDLRSIGDSFQILRPSSMRC